MRRVAGYVAKWAGMATKWAGMLASLSQTQPVPGVHAYSVLVGIRLVGLYLSVCLSVCLSIYLSIKHQPVQTNRFCIDVCLYVFVCYVYLHTFMHIYIYIRICTHL